MKRASAAEEKALGITQVSVVLKLRFPPADLVPTIVQAPNGHLHPENLFTIGLWVYTVEVGL